MSRVLTPDSMQRVPLTAGMCCVSQYQIPLTVVSYKELYGWTMDEIVREIGTKNNCTFCGVFRRQVLRSPLRIVPKSLLRYFVRFMGQLSCG